MPNMTPRLLRYCVFLAVLGFTSCSGLRKILPPPEQMSRKIIVQAEEKINFYDGEAHPVVIRVYQLSKRKKFEAASFWNLYKDSAPKEEGLILDKNRLLPIYPKEKREIKINLQEKTAFLGAFAEFSDHENKSFSAVFPISKKKLDAEVNITITRSGISFTQR